MDNFQDHSEFLESLAEERAQRKKWRDWWYRNRPDGEGETNLGILYQWVQVIDDDGKALATFLLRQSEGQLVGLEVAVLRKGCPPNPYEQGRSRLIDWRDDDPAALPLDVRLTPQEIDKRVEEMKQEFRANGWDDEDISIQVAESRALLERLSRGDTRIGDRNEIQVEPYLTTAWEISAAQNDGDLIPVLGVVPIASSDGDTRFKFRAGKKGFSVRGSILAPFLLGCRQQGMQYVPLSAVKRARRAGDKGTQI